MNNIPKLLLLLLCFYGHAGAQSLQTYKDTYPKDKVVYTKQVREYFFTKKAKQLDLRSTTTLQMLFMYNDANTYAQQSVYQSSFSAISNLKAKTVLDGKTLEVSNFVTKTNETRNVFFDDSKVIAFNLPNVSAGTTAEITYDTYYPNPVLLPDVYFTSYIPVHEQEAIFYVDKDIDFRFFEFNLQDFNIKYTKEEKRGKIIYKWSAKQVPEVHIDNFKFNSASKDLFLPHVITYIASYEQKDKVVKLQTNIDDLYNWSYGNLEAGIGNTVALSAGMKQTVDSIKNAAKGNDEQTLKDIYTYVQKNIYYVAIEDSLAGFIPRQPSLVLDRRYGDCKDMACLLHTMLNYAGFTSYPTWIGTRDIMYEVDKVPLLSCFNHMITAVDYKGNTLFLDPTMNYLPFNLPAYNIQGKQALISNGATNYKLLRVPTSPPVATTIADTTVLQLAQDGMLTGTVTQHRTGYLALLARNQLNYFTAKDFDKDMNNFLQRGNSKCVISKPAVRNLSNVYKPLICESQLQLPDYVSSNGNNTYINLCLQKILNASTYPTENKLIAPTENDYTYEYTYVVRLNIPKGMALRYTPENFTYADDNFAASITYTTTPTEVVVVQRYSNKQLYWYKDYYNTWNEFQKKLVKNYKESVVLVKQ